MTIVDRYLLGQFCKIFLVCFVSFAGLYVVIHLFTNLDEVVEISGVSGGAETLIYSFYGPRILDFFNRTVGILILISAVFTISMMQRRRESTATEAAGITKARLVRPLIVAAIVIIAMAAVSRELYIPKYKTMLVRSLTNWDTGGSVPMQIHKNAENGILIKGNELIVGESIITDIQLNLPSYLNTEFVEIKAKIGIVKRNDEQYPNGILLQKIIEPSNLLNGNNIVYDDKTVVYSPVNNSWLAPGELFVVCNLDVQELAYGENLFQYSSLQEMTELLRKPSRRFGMGNQVAIHQRIMKPILELTIVLVGLPLVICDPNRNIFLGAAQCIVTIFVIEITTVASHALGIWHIVSPASLAAWLPVLIFLPLSVFSVRKLFD